MNTVTIGFEASGVVGTMVEETSALSPLLSLLHGQVALGALKAFLRIVLMGVARARA